MEICSYLHTGKILIHRAFCTGWTISSNLYEILLELREEGEGLCHVQCCVTGMCTGLSGILNRNGQ